MDNVPVKQRSEKVYNDNGIRLYSYSLIYHTKLKNRTNFRIITSLLWSYQYQNCLRESSIRSESKKEVATAKVSLTNNNNAIK